MKDERNHYDAVELEQQICGSVVNNSLLWEKTRPILPPLVGLTAGWQADKIWVDFKIFKIYMCEN